MKILLAFLVLSCVVLVTQQRTQEAGPETDDECLTFARQGNCEFYNCFNSRHQCREYLVDHALDLCQKLEERRPQFTVQGQGWLRNDTKCIMRTLYQHYYRSEVVDCEELTDAGYSIYQNCSLAGKPNVCDIIWDNMEHFMAVTNMRSLRDAKHALTTMGQCGWQSLQRFISYLRDSDISIPNPFRTAK